LRKLKKLMCIALCLVMSLQLVSFTALADSDLSEYTAEVNLLTALGITDGIHFQSQADNLVTRYEFAILLTRLLNVDASKYSSSTVINDVSNAQKPYAAYLMDNGIMKGDGQGNFLPNSHVTVHQALVTVMRILGYDVIADAKGGTEGFYAEVASKLELDAGIMRYRDDRIQYKNVIRIFYNALHTGLYVQTVFGNEEKFATDTARTLLYDRFDIKITEGMINATDASSIEGGVVANGYIKIDDYVYIADLLELEHLMGYYVTAYYKDYGSSRELVHVDENEYSSSVTYDSAYLTYSDYTYVYEDDDGKEKDYYLDREGFTVIINGAFAGYTEDVMVPASGTVTLVNTDSDKKYETVVIRDERIEVVQSYNPSEEIISFKYGSKPVDLKKFDDDKIKIYNPNGRLTDVSAFKDGVVVTILENKGYLTIYVSANTVKGSVNELYKGASAITVVIDGKEFIVSPLYKEAEVKVGLTGTFYLDSNDKIVNFKEGTDLWDFGYIFDAAKETALDSVYKFEVFDATCLNETKIMEAAKTITINGDKCEASGISKKTGANLLKAFEGTPKFVRFKVNGKGQITEIQTADTAGFVRLDVGETDNVFDSTKLGFFGRVMGKKYAIGDTATIFAVPTVDNAGVIEVDFANKDKFAVVDYSYITAQADSTSYYTMAFGKDEDTFMSDAIILGSVATTFTRENSVMGIVSKVSSRLNADGEEVSYIEVYTTSGQYVGAYADPKLTYTAPVDTIGEKDIIRYQFVGDTIRDIQLVYDRNGNMGTVKQYQATSFTDISKGWHKMFDYEVYKIDGTYIQYNTPFAAPDDKVVLPASGASIVICSTKNGKTTFSTGGVADIKDIVHYGTSSDVVTYMYNTINAIYIYE